MCMHTVALSQNYVTKNIPLLGGHSFFVNAMLVLTRNVT